MLLNNNPLNIFHLDWVFIDTIIIILLIVLLILVKIYKITARWRRPFSNEALEIRKYDKSDIKFKTLNINLKKWSLIRNKTLIRGDNSKPIIVIIRTNHKKKLLRVLTEGLSSYHLKVIIIDLRIKLCPNHNHLEKIIQEEIRHIISVIINFFKQQKLLITSNYFVINHFKSNFSYKSLLIDTNNVGMALINPRLNKINRRNFTEIINHVVIKTQLFLIFSKKSNFFLNNKNLKIFLKEFPIHNSSNLNILTLEKSKKSLKYYETILLGIIVDILENNSLKFQAIS
ncbi:MAG: hypothetical protein ACTSRI_10865 [Promethearchaeota archaeon]